MTRRKTQGRTSPQKIHLSLQSSTHRYTSVALVTAVLQVPAFFSSCERASVSTEAHTETQIYIQWTKNTTPDAIDLFFFDTQGAQKLDTYQQLLDVQGDSRPYGVSGAGPKQLVALSGKAGYTDPWLDILNYGSLCKKTYRLEDEDLDAPRLVAETRLDGSASRMVLLHMQPAGTEYKPLGPEGGHPVSWINAGALDSLASLALPQPWMVLQEGVGDIGKVRRYPDRQFFCYANPRGQDGIPRTRLVLEGTLDGQHCYYPLEISHLEAGKVYNFDITRRRMGSPDPDIPVSSDAVLVETQIIPWESREAYTVTF